MEGLPFILPQLKITLRRLSFLLRLEQVCLLRTKKEISLLMFVLIQNLRKSFSHKWMTILWNFKKAKINFKRIKRSSSKQELLNLNWEKKNSSQDPIKISNALNLEFLKIMLSLLWLELTSLTKLSTCLKEELILWVQIMISKIPCILSSEVKEQRFWFFFWLDMSLTKLKTFFTLDNQSMQNNSLNLLKSTLGFGDH